MNKSILTYYLLVVPSEPGFQVDFCYDVIGKHNGRTVVEKQFAIDDVTDRRVLDWLHWLTTGSGKPWGWLGYLRK